MKRCFSIALLAIASCGGGASASGAGGGDALSPDGGPRDMTPDAVCTYYAIKTCEADQKCSADFVSFWNDMALCKERYKIGCLTGLASPGVSDTPSRLVACVDALSQLSCRNYLDFDRWPEPCSSLPGQLQDGAACVVGSQCQGYACDIANRAACGVCKTVSKPGDACTSQLDCIYKLPCVNGVCTPHPTLGEPCDNHQRYCAYSFVCRNVDASGLGVCSEPQPAGAECDPNAPGGDECDVAQGDICDHVTKRCTAGPIIRRIGESCSDFSSCAFNAFCNAKGVCEPSPREGQPCVDSQCLHPARCIDGLCRLRDPAMCQ